MLSKRYVFHENKVLWDSFGLPSDVGTAYPIGSYQYVVNTKDWKILITTVSEGKRERAWALLTKHKPNIPPQMLAMMALLT